MPFRTRDFLVFMLTVAFLVIGIASTASMDIKTRTQASAVITSEANDEEIVYQAVLPEQEADTRQSRLVALREKISNLVLDRPKEPEPEVIVADELVDDSSSEVTNEIKLCTSYQKIVPNWSSSNLLFEVVEGARIIYRKAESVPIVEAMNLSSTTPPSREVVLQLPLRTFPLSEKTCIGTDVVGVALDGSLIRNDEHSLYKVFGSETLIGYALDGFPIYGLDDNLKTDECGGSTSAGEYRYYLASEREAILACYGGIPVSL